MKIEEVLRNYFLKDPQTTETQTVVQCLAA